MINLFKNLIKKYKKQYIKQKIYIINGMQRSGNHAIANWVLAHIGDSDYFDSMFCSNMDGIFDHVNDKTTVLGLENVVLSPDCFYNDDEDKYKIYLIIILRNPINHLPSLVSNKHHRFSTNYYDNVWIAYRNMMQTKYKNIILVPLYFDKWFENPELRNKLGKKLGFKNKELGINKVSGAGGGSSFDGVRYNKRAQAMNIINRWQQLIWRPQHKDFLTKLKPMIEKDFGPIPEELL